MSFCVADFRAQARRRLPRLVFDYLEGGADDEVALKRNRRAIDLLCLRPSALVDVSHVDASIELFGQRHPLPLVIAPTGLNGLFWPDGDLALAHAAAAANIPFTMSSASNARLERVPAEAGGVNWFQLYVMGERKAAERMMARAYNSGYTALMLTVDVPVGGHRERDLRNGFKLPFKISPRLALDLALHPRWLTGLMRGGMPNFVNLADADSGETSEASIKAQAALLARSLDRTLVWENLSWIRRHWPGTLMLKGILNPEDARLAMAHGIDGLIVSNHGGRQLDAAQASIEVLPEIIAAVHGRLPVLVDGGFRRGTDIVKALALGARAVLLGRATLYGLAADGEGGASAVLQLLGEDILRTMALMGTPSVRDLTPERVIRPIS
jgi:(S)-mandelate dehydrogenase